MRHLRLLRGGPPRKKVPGSIEDGGDGETGTAEKSSLLKKALLAPIAFYQWVTQNTIYRLMSKLGIDVCLYRRNGKDSCSEYTTKAIKEYGALKGGWYGACRIMGCNPVNALFVQAGWKTELNDPAELHGNFSGRKKAPEWLDETYKGPLYEKYTGKKPKKVIPAFFSKPETGTEAEKSPQTEPAAA